MPLPSTTQSAPRQSARRWQRMWQRMWQRRQRRSISTPWASTHATNKFLGNAPTIFTGDSTKVNSFLTQGELYCSINTTNTAIQNQYQKMMLFLTYIQHDLVHVWVVAASRWLVNKVTNFRVNQYDPYLWESIKGAFHRQFMDTLEKE